MQTETSKFFLTEIGTLKKQKKVLSTIKNSNNVSDTKIEDSPFNDSKLDYKEISHKQFQDFKLNQTRTTRAIDRAFFPNLT